MNSVIMTENELISEKVYQLSESSSCHLRDIVKVAIGDELKATILNKGLAKCRVIQVSPFIQLEIVSEIQGKSFPIHFVIGASRPPTMKKLFEHGSSLGLQNFHIFKAALSEKSYLQSKLLKGDNPSEFTRLGLSQSAVFFKEPKVEIKEYLNQLELPETEQKFILSPYGESHIKDIDLDINEISLFAIGPERGWTEDEVEVFKSKGFKEIKISPSILRVEIASFSLLGYLNQLMD